MAARKDLDLQRSQANVDRLRRIGPVGRAGRAAKAAAREAYRASAVQVQVRDKRYRKPPTTPA